MAAEEKNSDKSAQDAKQTHETVGEPAADPKSQPQAAPAVSQGKPTPAAHAAESPAKPEPQTVRLTPAAAETPQTQTRIEPHRIEEKAAPPSNLTAQAQTRPERAIPANEKSTDSSILRKTVPEPAAPLNFAVVTAPPVPAPVEFPHRPDDDLEMFSDEEAERRIRSKSRRSFLWGAAAIASTWAGLEWLGTRRPDRGVAWPFRRLLEVNENLSRDIFSSARLAPEFPKSVAKAPRPNGSYGVATEENPDWQLRLVGLADMSAAEAPDAEEADTSSEEQDTPEPDPADKKGGAKPVEHDKKGGAKPPPVSSDESDSSGSAPVDKEPAVVVSLKEIQALPRTEIVTELKCIEGWSTIVHWVGCRLLDFMKKYPPATKSGRPFDPNRLDDLPEYVSMETPDAAYYVSLDMASALHPQTLLCYEMNGKPLELEHGAPLRLAIPVKYGIKNIKNIGKIKFTDERPRDYWGELGYDWYAGH